MSYVSEEMYIFFQNIIVSKNGDITYVDEALFSAIKDYDEKIRIVLHHLTQNYIFNIRSKTDSKAISVFYTSRNSCSCPRCTYDKLDFQTLLKNLVPQKDISLKDMLKYAYINMKVGNYKTANDIYESICEKVLANKKSKRIWIIYFIAKYNQKHLSKFLHNFFWE